MDNKEELLNRAITIHNKYQTEGVYKEELDSIYKELSNYLDSLPKEEPSNEEKLFIDGLFKAQINILEDKGMMNEGYILDSRMPGLRLHYVALDEGKEDSDSLGRTLCAKLEPIK